MDTAEKQLAVTESAANELALIRAQLGAISENLRLLREAVELVVADR
jgi:hypothetical protein